MFSLVFRFLFSFVSLHFHLIVHARFLLYFTTLLFYSSFSVQCSDHCLLSSSTSFFSHKVFSHTSVPRYPLFPLNSILRLFVLPRASSTFFSTPLLLCIINFPYPYQFFFWGGSSMFTCVCICAYM